LAEALHSEWVSRNNTLTIHIGYLRKGEAVI